MTLQTVQHTRMHLFGHDLNKTYKCTVRYLDDSSWETTYSKHEDSQKIFDRICNHINLIEKDYFGLRFIDETKQRKWLDLGKNARKQLKKAGREENVIVSFRVKFYPPDPMTRLNEELTRYQLFLQLRRDLQHGRLYGSSGDEALLLACILQSELGDIPAGTERIPEEYRSLMKHGKKGELKTLEQWNKFRTTRPIDCEARFLAHASGLDTFGIDPHLVKNEASEQVFLGYNHFGFIAFQGSRKITHLDWAHILKMTYEKKTFLVYYVRDSKKTTRGFKCPTPKAAKHLWRNALETKIFFTAPTSRNVAAITNDGSLFSRASRLRFSGRVAREAFDNSQAQQRTGVTFPRVAFGQKPSGDAEVYEGVLATPGLHRRPSIYPVGKERELSAARSSVVEHQIPSSPETPMKTLVPEYPHHDPVVSGWNSHSAVVEPEVLNFPTAPLSIPSETSANRILDITRTRVDEVFSQSNGSLLDRRLSEDRAVTPPVVTSPRRSTRTSPLGLIAVGALVAGTTLLSIYTLFETNWLSAEISYLYAPIKDFCSQLFFAGEKSAMPLSIGNETGDFVAPPAGLSV